MVFDISAGEVQAFLPEYSINQRLRPSAQKAVFIAEDKDKKKVALKIYNPHANIERLRREIEVMMKLDSPYVASLIEFNQRVTAQGSIIYIVEEFVDGPDLATVMENKDTMKEQELIPFLGKLLFGLRDIWEHKVVHRDIKPANIMINSNGDPVIIDFGIARNLELETITQTQLPIGLCTPKWGAPEQILNKKTFIDCRSDIYSLGLIAYELVTGVHPIWKESISFDDNLQRMLSIQSPKLEKDMVHSSLGNYIYKMTQLEPFKRFRNPNIAIRNLKSIADEIGCDFI